MRLGIELKQSEVYLHDSDLLLQVSRYDCNTGQGHETLSAQTPKETELE